MADFKPFFNALFREGTLTKEIDLGMDIDQFKRRNKKLNHEGNRLVFLYHADGSYQAAWQKSSERQEWLVTDDFDELQSVEKAFHNDGFRFQYLSVQEGHMIAIWHPGSGGEFWEVNIGYDALKVKDDELRSKGFVMKRLCNDDGKYSAFWQPGNKKYAWIVTNKREDFDAFIKKNEKKGLLGVSYGGDDFCAIFHEEKGDQVFTLALDEKNFKKRSEELFKDHFHIVDLYITIGNS